MPKAKEKTEKTFSNFFDNPNKKASSNNKMTINKKKSDVHPWLPNIDVSSKLNQQSPWYAWVTDARVSFPSSSHIKAGPPATTHIRFSYNTLPPRPLLHKQSTRDSHLTILYEIIYRVFQGNVNEKKNLITKK